MADEQIQKLLQGALKAAREGNAEQARKAFLYVLKTQPTNEVAWMGLATVAQDQREQIIALQKAVDINPQNTRARAALERISGAQPPAQSAPTPPPAPAAPQRMPDEPTMVLPTAPTPPAEDDYVEEYAEEEYVEEEYSEDEAYDQDADDDFMQALRDDVTQDTAPDGPPTVPASAELSTPATMPASPLSAPAPTSPILPETPLFSNLLLTPPGEEGVPVPKRRVIETVAQQGESMINAYLHQEMEDRLIEWQRKPRGRAGEREITNFRLAVGSAVAVLLLFVVGLPLVLYLNSPEYQKLVFAPTWTVSPTFTFTPSSTPGATFTSSPTPLQSSTPTPTLDASVTPGLTDRLFPPDPTRIYFPSGVQRSGVIEDAVADINAGNYEEAATRLAQEQNANELTGDFMPYYYMAQVQIEQGDLEGAQETVTRGRVNWEDKGREGFFEPMIRVLLDRLAYLNLTARIAAGEPVRTMQNEIDDLIDSELEVINLGGNFDEPYLLLADLYRLSGDYQDALDMLTEAQTGQYRAQLFSNTRIRLKKAEVLRDRGQLDEALFELDDLLRLNPFEEPALLMRMEIAFQKNNPGLAVLYARDYQYYYPANIQGYRYMGDAYVMEGKIGEAMVEYTQALQGDPTDPSYADVLASRAAVYTSQGRNDLALADVSQALEIQPQNMDFRWQRYQLAYLNQDYELATEDLTILQTANAISEAQFVILNARIQMDQEELDEEGELQQTLTTLRNLRPGDIPDELRPVMDETIARIEFALGNANRALQAVDAALNAEGTASRHVLRGQILQAQAEAATRDDARLDLYVQAQREYDFVLSWSVLYRYPFLEDVQERYETVTAEVERLRTELAEED